MLDLLNTCCSSLHGSFLCQAKKENHWDLYRSLNNIHVQKSMTMASSRLRNSINIHVRVSINWFKHVVPFILLNCINLVVSSGNRLYTCLHTILLVTTICGIYNAVPTVLWSSGVRRYTNYRREPLIGLWNPSVNIANAILVYRYLTSVLFLNDTFLVLPSCRKLNMK